LFKAALDVEVFTLPESVVALDHPEENSVNFLEELGFQFLVLFVFIELPGEVDDEKAFEEGVGFIVDLGHII
jgi:hypothetical protein